MAFKLVFVLGLIGLASLSMADARRLSAYPEKSNYLRRINVGSVDSPQGRLLPGAIAVKKLVLLKFKKIVPISLILLRSGNDNEAELVPVYPTSEIPDNVKFIPTPNGIAGHRDVQAIAIPADIHDQLEADGLTDIDAIESLLEIKDVNQDDKKAEMPAEEEAPLLKDDDEFGEQQLVEIDSVASTPVASRLVKTTKTGLNGVKNGYKVKGLRNHGNRGSFDNIPIYYYRAGSI